MSSDELRSELQGKWTATCKEMSVSDDLSSKWFEVLASRYSESGRYYHTLNHIKEMLGWVDRYSSELQSVAIVSLATWFHEYVISGSVLTVARVSLTSPLFVQRYLQRKGKEQ